MFGLRPISFRGGPSPPGSPSTTERFEIQSVSIGDPSQAARGDSSDAECDTVAIAQLLRAFLKQPDQARLTLPKPRKQRL